MSVAFEPLVAEILALIAFVELGFAITAAIRMRRSKQPLVRSIRVVNVGSALVLLVLAQAAILSFASTVESSWGVGVSALLFGGATMLGGLSLVIHSARRARALLVDDPYDPLIAEAVGRQPVELPPLAAAVAGVREAWGAVPAPAGTEVRDRLRIVSRTPSLRGALARNSGATTDAIAGALRSRGASQRDAAHCRGRDDRCAERGPAGVGGRRRPRPGLRDRGRATSARRR